MLQGKKKMMMICFTVVEMKIFEFADSADPDEVSHNEAPHLDLHRLPLVFEFLIIYSWTQQFLKFC